MPRPERLMLQRGPLSPWPPSPTTPSAAPSLSPLSPLSPRAERQAQRRVTPRPLAGVPLPASLSSPILVRSPRRVGGGSANGPGARGGQPADSPKGSFGGSVAQAATHGDAQGPDNAAVQRDAMLTGHAPQGGPHAAAAAPPSPGGSVRSSLSIPGGAWRGPGATWGGIAGAAGSWERPPTPGAVAGAAADAAKASEQAAVCVALHVRPMSAAEAAQGCKPLLAVAPGGTEVSAALRQ